METALEENRRMNSDRAEAMLVRAFNMYRHPLLLSLQVDAKNNAIAAAMGTEKETSAGKERSKGCLYMLKARTSMASALSLFILLFSSSAVSIKDSNTRI